MKLKQSIEGKQYLAIVIAVAIMLILFIALFFSGFFQESGNYENEEVCENMTFEELNETLTAELDQMKFSGILVTRKEIDAEQKIIIIYEAGMTDDQISELEKKKIDGWKITVQPDVDYINEKEAAMDEIKELKKDPELEIAGFMPGGGEKEVMVWVYNRTSENEALDGKVIHGWTIRIYTSPTPPPTERVR